MNFNKKRKYYYITPLVLQFFLWIMARMYFSFSFDYRIKGIDRLKQLNKEKIGVIFTVNHSSELDPILVRASLNLFSRFKPMYYVSREKEFYSTSGWRQHFYGGRFFNWWGAYPVYVGLKDYEKSLRNHIELLEMGRSICIFPEGKKTKDGNIGEGKAGAVFLSQRTNAAIVPVRIKGLFYLDDNKNEKGKNILDVTFGEPVYPEKKFEGNTEDLKRETAKIMDKIKSL